MRRRPPKPPEMVEPTRIAKPPPDAPSRSRTEPSTVESRTPTAGAEIKTGSARVEHRRRGDSVRRSRAGRRRRRRRAARREELLLSGIPGADGPDGSAQNWNANQGAGGQPIIKFTIRRDGMLTNVELEKSSGQALLDLEARRAVIKTMQLPPLPREFTGELADGSPHFRFSALMTSRYLLAPSPSPSPVRVAIALAAQQPPRARRRLRRSSRAMSLVIGSAAAIPACRRRSRCRRSSR